MMTPTQPSPVAVEKQSENKPQTSRKWDRRLVMLGASVSAIALCMLIAEIAVLVHEMIREKIWRSNPQELEKTISEKYSQDFTNKIKSLASLGLDEIHLFKRLSISQGDEIKIISSLEKDFEISPEHLKEILMGAHVRLDDEGQTYDTWLKDIEEKHPRPSCHPSDKNTTQYGVRGSLIKELLFSRISEKNPDGNQTSYTWFQLENHPVSFGHIIRHMIDYVKYQLTNKNQGPYGASHATDRAPIILKLKKSPRDQSPTASSSIES